MNRDILEGKWKQLKGAARTQWGKLTDDDVDIVAGNYEQLVGRLQERYGVDKEEASKMVDDWNWKQVLSISLGR